MGSLGTLLIIIAVVAFKYFGELATNKEANQPAAPTDEEKQDIERKIREILGDTTTEKRVATTPAQPTPQMQRNSAPKAYTASQAPKTRKTQSPSILPASPSKKQGRAINETQNRDNNSRPSTERSEIEAIIDDFTMEKAVIYAEILEPKFKQY